MLSSGGIKTITSWCENSAEANTARCLRPSTSQTMRK
uniref:Uncharacterized protein n=1 Tax=Anguilla anguilla TaxID=7936 RepID=A0A0E9XC19_ANGAN